ncbi:MAG TPA: hypothetical protein VFE24_17890 [Pirellulales bacterium]|nr:hypothetical protein [Pirellulales bacterium]
MHKWIVQLWRDESGVLTFEWVLLATLLTIGIVSGLTAVRDALIDEFGDVAEAASSIDLSYTLAPDPTFGFGGASYTQPKSTVTRCGRGTLSAQTP